MNEKEILLSTYLDFCDILRPTKGEINNKTIFEDMTIAVGVRCALSQSGGASINQSPSFSKASHELKLFLSPDVDIKANDIVIVLYQNKKIYRLIAGKPAAYPSHLEVPMKEESEVI